MDLGIIILILGLSLTPLILLVVLVRYLRGGYRNEDFLVQKNFPLAIIMAVSSVLLVAWEFIIKREFNEQTTVFLAGIAIYYALLLFAIYRESRNQRDGSKGKKNKSSR
jgi:hypothetical protein